MSWAQFSTLGPTTPTEVSRALPQSLHKNAAISYLVFEISWAQFSNLGPSTPTAVCTQKCCYIKRPLTSDLSQYIYVNRIYLTTRHYKISRWKGIVKWSKKLTGLCYSLPTSSCTRFEILAAATVQTGVFWVTIRSRDSVVGIATGYGQDDRSAWVRVPVGSRISSSPRRPDRLWGPPNLPSNGYRGQSGPGVKLTTHLQIVTRSRRCDLCIHTSIRLHGIVLS
jgi:hypothetical protein